MSSSNVQYKGGVGICGWMFLIFLTLKLTGYIAWSWWWVTAPLWIPVAVVLGIPVAVVLGILLVIGVSWLIAEGFDSKSKKRFK